MKSNKNKHEETKDRTEPNPKNVEGWNMMKWTDMNFIERATNNNKEVKHWKDYDKTNAHHMT